MSLFRSAELDDLQRIVVPNVDPSRQKVSKDKLIAAASMVAPQFLKQVQDSIKLVNETTTAKVFFERYDFLLDRLHRLSVVERYVKLSGEPPSVAVVRIENLRDEATNDFINRAFQKAISEAQAQKTEKSKINKMTKYFETMDIYIEKFRPKNTYLLNQLKEQCIIKIN